MEIRFDRLRECTAALREAPAPSKFTMAIFFHKCGTPACVLGHHEAKYGRGIARFVPNTSFGCMNDWKGSGEYFGISHDQWAELFSMHGCGNAATPAEAIAYIEGFIRKHGGEVLDPAFVKLKGDMNEWEAAAILAKGTDGLITQVPS